MVAPAKGVRRVCRPPIAIISMSVVLLLSDPATAAQFVGGPSVRVTANAQVEFKWVTDVAWLGKLEVFTTADGTGVPWLTKHSEDDFGTPTIATQHIVTVPVGPGLAANTAYFFRITASDP